MEGEPSEYWIPAGFELTEDQWRSGRYALGLSAWIYRSSEPPGRADLNQAHFRAQGLRIAHYVALEIPPPPGYGQTFESDHLAGQRGVILWNGGESGI